MQTYVYCTLCVIGERERANLVVQLARFFGISLCLSGRRARHTVMFYVTLNKRNPVTFATHPQHARAHYFSKTLLLVAVAGTQGRGVRHERKSRTLWQKSIGNHWKSVGNHGNLARNQKSGPSRNQEISEKSQNNEKHPLFV